MWTILQYGETMVSCYRWQYDKATDVIENWSRAWVLETFSNCVPFFTTKFHSASKPKRLTRPETQNYGKIWWDMRWWLASHWKLPNIPRVGRVPKVENPVSKVIRYHSLVDATGGFFLKTTKPIHHSLYSHEWSANQKAHPAICTFLRNPRPTLPCLTSASSLT